MELIFGLIFILFGFLLIKGLVQLSKFIDSGYKEYEIKNNIYSQLVIFYLISSIIIIPLLGLLLILSFFGIWERCE